MHLLLLPGMDGTGQLFEPLLKVLSPSLAPVVVAYPVDRPLDYASLLPLLEIAIPSWADFVVVAESFSGPLAILLAAARPPGLRGVVLCASFARSPLPLPAHWLCPLVRPLLFRLAPMPLLRRVLLGRYHATPLGEQLTRALASVSPAVLAARARTILAVDVGKHLQLCPVPVLYLRATEDRLVGTGSLAYVRRMGPTVEVVSLPGPHLLLQAAAVESAAAIERFAARCAVGRVAWSLHEEGAERRQRMREHGPWKVRSSREVHRDPWVRLTVDDVVRPDGSPGTFTVARVKAGVSILALDGAGNAHLTEEFRYAIGRRSLEVVSGGTDEGEDPLAAARRELKEELGIEAAEWSDLGMVDPVTSMVHSPVRLFLARELSQGQPQREGTEQIKAITMPLNEAVQAVLDGRITHAPSCVLLLRAALLAASAGRHT